VSAASEVLDRARAAGLTIATAESCTGGMLAAALTDPAGASDVFGWGVVTYANAAKTALLGVKPATLEAHGAVSEEVAREMALGLRAISGADLAVAITGIAGPGGSGAKPEGRVCFALAGPRGVSAETVEFGAQGRAPVRRAARDHALKLLAGALPPKNPAR
jgi:nicotinamide-nucleotide amidase